MNFTLPGARMWSLLCLAFVASACGLDAHDSSTPQVVGPQSRPAQQGEWPSTLAIYRGKYIHCTGTLVAPNLVVTAAHCVRGLDATNLSVRVGLGDGAAPAVPKSVKVVDAKASPWYKRDAGGNGDVAYLVLETPLDDVDIVPVATDIEELRTLLRPGVIATVVGFGIHDNKTQASGVKYVGPARIKMATGNELIVGDEQGDTCNGDSGGPAFGQLDDGSWRVYGVTSRGPDVCGQANWPGISGLMHWHVCWIEKTSGIKIPSSTLDCAAFEPADQPVPQATLADLCAAPDLPAPARQTLWALKAEFARQSRRPMKARQVSCRKLAAWAARVEKLDLARSMITDLSLLTHFPALTTVNLTDNLIRDVAPLANLAQLESARLAWNEIDDFDVLAPRLEAGLYVTGQSLQRPKMGAGNQSYFKKCSAAHPSTTPLFELASLEAIRNWACEGKRNCSCDREAKNLESSRYVDLSGLELFDLSSIADSASIQHLNISGLNIFDLTTLASLENLEVVDVEGAHLGSLAVLDELVARKGLTVKGKPLPPIPMKEARFAATSLPRAIAPQGKIEVPIVVDKAHTLHDLRLNWLFDDQSAPKVAMTLVHPDGTELDVSTQPGFEGGLWTGRVGFASRFASKTFAALAGKPAQGTWRLIIHERANHRQMSLVALEIVTISQGPAARR